MARTCSTCGKLVEANMTQCPDGHPQPSELSGAQIDFHFGSSLGQDLHPTSTADLGMLPGTPDIKPITVSDLPTRGGALDNVPEIALPLISAEAARAADYVTLAKFQMPEGEPALIPLSTQVAPDKTVHALDAGTPDQFRWVCFSADGTWLKTINIPRGTGINIPGGIAIDAQMRLYVADLGANCIRRFDTTGASVALDQAASLGAPLDVDMDSSGNLIVAESSACRISKLDPSGARVWSFGSPASAAESHDEEEEEEEEEETATGDLPPDRLSSPSAVALDAQDNIFVADTNNQRILKLGANGAFVGLVARCVELLFPSSLKVTATGELFVADLDGTRIHKFDPNGECIFSLTFESGTGGGEFDIDENGDLFIPSKANQAILKVRRAG